MRLLTLNRVYVAYLIVFVGIVTGMLPRQAAVAATVLLSFWMVRAPLESAVLFFVRAIPIFIALPLTASFDNFNMWRLLSLLIITRYVFEPANRALCTAACRELLRRPASFLRQHPVARRLGILLLLAGASLINARYPVIGFVRILYFVNLSMVPFVVWRLIRQRRIPAEPVFSGIAVATASVVVVGFLQLASTYLMDVYQFMQIWGEGIQLRQFGTEWSRIAVWVGNTWLAYYGDQLSLRVFSLFPDSHSFPTFVLLGLPALLAVSFDPIIRIASTTGITRLWRTYAGIAVLWVPAAFLAVILSGTRGVWAASIGVALLVPCWLLLMRAFNIDLVRRRLFAYSASYLVAFFMLFAVAWPIFISPQFLVGKGDFGLFANRIRSVIDFGETSNALRIAIWKESIASTVRHPFLGVGIGNFPVVLGQDIGLARAGSTAHNLYLHIAAEMGIFAALESIVLLISSVLAAYRWFQRAVGRGQIYAGALLLFLPWVYAYVLTDPILFDERVFLLFATTLALAWSHEHEL